MPYRGAQFFSNEIPTIDRHQIMWPRYFDERSLHPRSTLTDEPEGDTGILPPGQEKNVARK